MTVGFELRARLRPTLRKLAMLFRRDLAIARSYRAAFVLEIFQALFGVASFYFLSRFVESPQLERAVAPPRTEAAEQN